ncbi:FAD binding domain-containing protein [Oscillibacter sp.]|uniref:FAD binding domain-containing protein n=1 Tax=Oscillibacter sp. TaxID=1945593 RepID=UPI0028A7C4F1|nr:FAD binding domain-containing protein [Oscillibacter sp.]
MIPFDFEYYRPDTAKGAVSVFAELEAKGKNPVFYGGGSELISMARVGSRSFGAVVDLKNISECTRMEDRGDYVYLGAGLTLSDLIEWNGFPLLAKTAGRIADHTMQCKITLGGNLAATIIYRETALPLLLSDAKLTFAAADGFQEYEIDRVFQERLFLPPGAFLAGVTLDKRFFSLPYFHEKKTRNEKIDYPLITAAGLKKEGALRIAFSGLAAFPFRNSKVEKILNSSLLSREKRADKVVKVLSEIIQSDLSGSAEYRKFVLKETILNILDTMEGV